MVSRFAMASVYELIFLALCFKSSLGLDLPNFSALPENRDETYTLRESRESAENVNWVTVQPSKNLSDFQQSTRNARHSSTEKIRCWRYCLENATKENSDDQLLKLSWIFEKDSNSTDRGSVPIPTISMEALENGQSPGKKDECENFVVLGCQVREAESFPQKLPIMPGNTENILIQSREARGITEKKFNISGNAIGVSVNVAGNVSRIHLELPIKWASEVLDATLFAKRMRDAMDVHLNVRNPPEGEWRLKLLGVENVKYRLTVTTEEKNSQGRDGFAEGAKNMQLIEGDNGQNPRAKRVLPEDVDLIQPYEETEDADEVTTLFLDEKEQPGVMRESEVVETLENGNASLRFNWDQSKMNEPLEIDEFNGNDGFSRRPYIIVDVKPSTKLIIEPNTFQPVIFEVVNNYPFNIHIFLSAVSSQFYISPFMAFRNNYVMTAGETKTVTLNVRAPFGANVASGELTLAIYSQGPIRVMAKKTVFIVVKDSTSKVDDDVRPTLNYYFNSNCNGHLSNEHCSKVWWSVEIEAQDFQSGLKVVTSSRAGLYPLSDYTSGTKSLQRFSYAASCCKPEVEIEAIDVLDNRQSKSIDVRAWYNLSGGEIAAIVLGVLLGLLLIVLIVICIVYCVHRKKSLDLPYTQRYDSRSARRNEGTSF